MGSSQCTCRVLAEHHSLLALNLEPEPPAWAGGGWKREPPA